MAEILVCNDIVEAGKNSKSIVLCCCVIFIGTSEMEKVFDMDRLFVLSFLQNIFASTFRCNYHCPLIPLPSLNAHLKLEQNLIIGQMVRVYLPVSGTPKNCTIFYCVYYLIEFGMDSLVVTAHFRYKGMCLHGCNCRLSL